MDWLVLGIILFFVWGTLSKLVYSVIGTVLNQLDVDSKSFIQSGKELKKELSDKWD